MDGEFDHQFWDEIVDESYYLLDRDDGKSSRIYHHCSTLILSTP
jgi:hypothetical protein